MANVIEVTDSNFEDIIYNSNIPVMVNFWAIWCGPCKMVNPIVEQLAGEYDGKAIMASLDVDTNPNIPERYGIRNIPTLLFFEHGEIVDRQDSVASKRQLAEKLDYILEI